MPIPVITNFSINDSVPFDTRLVATSSDSMTNMLYKYAGLTTYRTDLGLNYTYNGSSWAVSSNGIYGGSGNLSSVNTTVGFGTVSTSLNNLSKYFTFKTYTDNSGEVHLDLENYFIRNTSGTSHYDVSYKSQLMFNDDAANENYPGPYIMYNPKALFSSGRGGISFGTLNEIDYLPYERMRIDGNGIIRFKPNATVGDSTKSVNIGIDSTNTRPFIGFNWNGSTVDDGTDASYVQFNDSVFSIHNFSSATGTHSAIFSKGLVRINGGLEVTGGTISTNKNISFGAADGGVYFVSSNGNGMKYDSSVKNYVALTYRANTQINDILTWNNSQITLLRPIIATGSATLTTYNTFNARYQTNIWDSDFNTDKVDSDWVASGLSGDSARQGETTNTVLVALSTTNQFKDFIFTIKSPYTNRTAKMAYSLTYKPYDRYLYFYNDGTNVITHNVEMFLLAVGLDPTDANNWVKVGFITNGNQHNWNQGLGIINTNYQVKYYSQSLIIPANMIFKIKFSFPYDYAVANYSLQHIVRTRIIRSGKWNAPGYSLTTPEIGQQIIDPTL